MLGLSQSLDPTLSLSRVRMIALKALEVDPEHAEALDILLLIDEHLGENMADAMDPTNSRDFPQEVRIVRRPSPDADGVEIPDMVITLESDVTPEVGAFMSSSTGVFETVTELGQQLHAAWAGWAVEGVRRGPSRRPKRSRRRSGSGWLAVPKKRYASSMRFASSRPTTWRPGRP